MPRRSTRSFASPSGFITRTLGHAVSVGALAAVVPSTAPAQAAAVPRSGGRESLLAPVVGGEGEDI